MAAVMTQITNSQPLMHLQDNELKHTEKAPHKWFKDHMVEVLERPGRSPDLNRIKSRWLDWKMAP